MLKAVLFDMDDTLVDWSARQQDWRDYDREHLRGVFDYAVRELQHPLNDFEAFVSAAQTRSLDVWAQARRNLRAPHLGRVLIDALGMLGVPEHRLDCDACLRAYHWQARPGVIIYPDAPETIALLRSHGLRLGLVTNAYQTMWMRDQELAQLGLAPELIDCRVSSADTGYLKPHPAIFQAALSCLGARPDEAVFIGDNPESDIAGAQAVGMRALLRVGQELPPMISGLIVPDAIIRSLCELPAILDGWYPGWRGTQVEPAQGEAIRPSVSH